MTASRMTEKIKKMEEELRKLQKEVAKISVQRNEFERVDTDKFLTAVYN